MKRNEQEEKTVYSRGFVDAFLYFDTQLMDLQNEGRYPSIWLTMRLESTTHSQIAFHTVLLVTHISFT